MECNRHPAHAGAGRPRRTSVSINRRGADAEAFVLVRQSADRIALTAQYEAVGGFSEDLPLNYNDVDFCLRLRERGLMHVSRSPVWKSITMSGK